MCKHIHAHLAPAMPGKMHVHLEEWGMQSSSGHGHSKQLAYTNDLP